MPSTSNRSCEAGTPVEAEAIGERLARLILHLGKSGVELSRAEGLAARLAARKPSRLARWFWSLLLIAGVAGAVSPVARRTITAAS